MSAPSKRHIYKPLFNRRRISVYYRRESAILYCALFKTRTHQFCIQRHYSVYDAACVCVC